MDNPYKPPNLDHFDSELKSSIWKHFRFYRVAAICDFLLAVCASIAIWRGAINPDYLSWVVLTEFLGVVVALALVPGLAVRAIYLMLHKRYVEGSVDFVLSAVALATSHIALNINPISG